jgi:nitroimidazol reductase NimA-like FMN-containing flavoprotein (pyridoxamine 5'-phosphate oxidase superfamily)
MRRHDKEIQDRTLINHILQQAQVCRLGLCRDNIPYVVPISFGYDGSSIYFHSAASGRKIDFFTANPQVCFEVEHDVKTIPNEDKACNWSVAFYSVIGWGTISELIETADKIQGLNQVMRHYSGREWEFESPMLTNTRVWRITVEEITGKQSRR